MEDLRRRGLKALHITFPNSSQRQITCFFLNFILPILLIQSKTENLGEEEKKTFFNYTSDKKKLQINMYVDSDSLLVVQGRS